MLVLLLTLSACGAGADDSLEPAADRVDVRAEQSALPQPAPPGREVQVDRPPLPEEIGPDGDLLPGSPKYQEREAARAEYEAFKARSIAAARALAPEVDAYARADARTAGLLAGATYDPASAVPVGGGPEGIYGATLRYALPAPRDFRYVHADFDSTRSEGDGESVEEHVGATHVTVVVNLVDDRLLGLTLEGSAEVTVYDARGTVLGTSRGPDPAPS